MKNRVPELSLTWMWTSRYVLLNFRSRYGRSPLRLIFLLWSSSCIWKWCKWYAIGRLCKFRIFSYRSPFEILNHLRADLNIQNSIFRIFSLFLHCFFKVNFKVIYSELLIFTKWTFVFLLLFYTKWTTRLYILNIWSLKRELLILLVFYMVIFFRLYGFWA